MRAVTVVFLLLALSSASAQQSREPLRGSAVREDGTPWMGATVHLLSRPMPNDERVGTPDEIEAATDNKGRFGVQLLPGRRYVAWAVEEFAEDHYRASFVSVRADGSHAMEAAGSAGMLASCDETQSRSARRGAKTWRPGIALCSSARPRAG